MKTVVTTTTVVFTKDFKNPYSVPAATEILLSDKVADKLIKLGYATEIVAKKSKSTPTKFAIVPNEEKPTRAQPE